MDLSVGSVDHLANGESKHGGFACTGLGLSDDIATLNDGQDRSLLNDGGLLEAVGVNASKEIILDSHLVEAHDRLHTLRGLEHQLFIVDGTVPTTASVPRHHRCCCGCCH